MDKKQFEELTQKLDLLISLLLRLQLTKQEGAMMMRNQIAFLDNREVRPFEIAKILGKTQSFVNKELSIIRRESKKPITKGEEDV